MKRCPICGSLETLLFDEREAVPVLLNRTYASSSEAKKAAAGALAMTGCTNCGFAFNAAFDPALMAYTEEYENDQSHSSVFRAHLVAMANAALRSAPHGTNQLDVLEVGAGQGRFLEILAELAGPRLATATGFDPAFRGGQQERAIRLYRDYFGPSTAHLLPRAPALTVSRHTIEHVQDPLAFLAEIRSGLGAESHSALVVETPCVEWILRETAVHDFFYEHCSLFSPYALRLALTQTGFGDAATAHVFGGQYLWATAMLKVSLRVEEPPRVASFATFAAARDAFVLTWQQRLAGHKGEVWLWGAGAKGVTFSLLVDPAGSRLSGLIDINPLKQGRFVPRTGLPILSPEAIAGKKGVMIIMNPNYVDEIRAACNRLAIDAEIAVL